MQVYSVDSVLPHNVLLPHHHAVRKDHKRMREGRSRKPNRPAYKGHNETAPIIRRSPHHHHNTVVLSRLLWTLKRSNTARMTRQALLRKKTKIRILSHNYWFTCLPHVDGSRCVRWRNVRMLGPQGSKGLLRLYSRCRKCRQ